MSDWISSLQAMKRLRTAGLEAPERTLGVWAEEGSLRSRATRGDFSSGEDPPGCVCWDGHPAYKDQLDSWPAIPSYFWNWFNRDISNQTAQYQTGIFATWVVPEAERGSSGPDSTHIKLYEVSFHSDDLEVLLDAHPSAGAKAPQPTQRWQQQRVSPRQNGAITFIDKAFKNPPKDPLGPFAMYTAYLQWHADPKNRQSDKPLVRSTFAKWQERYQDGWRVSDRLRWVHNP